MQMKTTYYNSLTGSFYIFCQLALIRISISYQLVLIKPEIELCTVNFIGQLIHCSQKLVPEKHSNLTIFLQYFPFLFYVH